MVQRRESRPLQGLCWMLASGLAMVTLNGAIKYVGPSLPAAQSAFLRFAFGVPLFLPMLRPILRAGYSRQIWALFCWRGASHVLAVILWFYAMARVPVAEVSAIGFLNPVILLLLGSVLMGEGVNLRRLLVAVVAFAGALIVLRPGLREVSLGHWSQLGAALCFAFGYLIANRLSARVPASVIVAMMTFTVTLGLLPLALWNWQPVAGWQILWLALSAVLATLGHYTMTRAFAVAPLSVTQPVIFVNIIWSSLLGAVFFGEGIDPWVILGSAIIIGAITVNVWAEGVERDAAVAARAGAVDGAA